jgi:hypothetical protein
VKVHGLTVTGGAVGHADGLNVVLLHERLAQGNSFGWLGWGLPGHAGDLVSGAQVRGGVAVTVQAPFHVKGLGFGDQGHRVDSAMTFVTAHAFVDVDGVVEEDVIRQIVDAVPAERLASVPAVADWLEQGSAGPELAVTFHARFGGGDSRAAGFLHGLMAVTTVNADIAHVVLVGEGHRLVNEMAYAGHVIGTGPGEKQRGSGGQDQDEENQPTDAKQIGSGFEDIGHEALRSHDEADDENQPAANRCKQSSYSPDLPTAGGHPIRFPFEDNKQTSNDIGEFADPPGRLTAVIWLCFAKLPASYDTAWLRSSSQKTAGHTHGVVT